jgi:phosphoadenosine phosphosulfate reductase
MLTRPAIEQIARTFEDAAAQDIIAWAVRVFGQRLAVACSFGGASGMVVLDMLVKIDATIPVYYLDTGLLFPQTHDHITRVSNHYGITPLRVSSRLSLSEQSDEFGPNLWERDPDRCCDLRKVQPQMEFLRDYAAWMTGIRRDQSGTRVDVPVVGWDKKFGLIKINPLATWTEAMVWTYITTHGVPYNPLHDRGFASIGCVTCTSPVKRGESPRAGRWSGFAKTECGLHAVPS